MVRAWYMDEEKTDQRLEHQRNPPKFIELNELYEKTGVEYFPVRKFSIWHGTCSIFFSIRFSLFNQQLNVDTFQTDGKLDKIRKERGYSYEDEVKTIILTIFQRITQ